MTVQIENPEDYNQKEKKKKKCLRPMSEFSKDEGYKIKQKSTVFLDTSNEHVDPEIKNTVSFTITKEKRNTWV